MSELTKKYRTPGISPRTIKNVLGHEIDEKQLLIDALVFIAGFDEHEHYCGYYCPCQDAFQRAAREALDAIS